MMVMWQHPCPFYQSFHTSSQLRKHIPDTVVINILYLEEKPVLQVVDSATLFGAVRFLKDMSA
jgi:hypothetical protein